jgi:hypothetical protein
MKRCVLWDPGRKQNRFLVFSGRLVGLFFSPEDGDSIFFRYFEVHGVTPKKTLAIHSSQLRAPEIHLRILPTECADVPKLQQLTDSFYWGRTHSVTHGAEPFLRSRQLCSHSRTTQHIYETRRFITVFTRAFY